MKKKGLRLSCGGWSGYAILLILIQILITSSSFCFGDEEMERRSLLGRRGLVSSMAYSVCKSGRSAMEEHKKAVEVEESLRKAPSTGANPIQNK